ncbi:MAG: V-type ATP synthase subunit I [Candidatus Omnitrophica bacterium]|nr:V-type ATP synthase subunit I [Candidatus Omnitrophota bacterium]
MAIAKVKKIEIIGLESDREKILALLQRLAVVELINVQQEPSSVVVTRTTADLQLSEIEEAISYLGNFRDRPGFLQSLVDLKPRVFESQINEIIAGFDYRGFIKELSRLRQQLDGFFAQKENLIRECQTLRPWQGLGIPLDEITFSRTCAVYLGRMKNRNYLALTQELETQDLGVYIELVYKDKTETYLCMIYLKEGAIHLEEILKRYQFVPVSLTPYRLTVRQRLQEIEKQIQYINQNIDSIRNNILDLAKDRFKLMITYDYLANIKDIEQVGKNLVSQRYTFSLMGWIRQRDVDRLKEKISEAFKDVALCISEPTDQTAIPGILENHPLIQHFEFITSIYGMPKYAEVDPTPFLAPFFFLYFGLCVSDAGYGLVLVFICWWVLKRFKLGSQGIRFWRLLLFCGISTIIIGSLTGSWFGNLLDLAAQDRKIFFLLKGFKDCLVLFDPLEQPQRLLGIALGLGVIQVWFGNVVATIGNIKNKRYRDIFLDQVPLLAFLFGLTGFGMIFLKVLKADYLVLFRYCVLAGGITLVFTQGRSERGIGSKLFYGIYNVYNAFSGYLSDILSYSRLWALGLVTGVMAQTINLIAIQFSQIIPSLVPGIYKASWLKAVFSSLMLILIFILGHGIAFLMNLLGAFVHPLRLQFVEFFSKFFKPGGYSFRPFKVETKYISLT